MFRLGCLLFHSFIVHPTAFAGFLSQQCLHILLVAAAAGSASRTDAKS